MASLIHSKSKTEIYTHYFFIIIKKSHIITFNIYIHGHNYGIPVKFLASATRTPTMRIHQSRFWGEKACHIQTQRGGNICLQQSWNSEKRSDFSSRDNTVNHQSLCMGSLWRGKRQAKTTSCEQGSPDQGHAMLRALFLNVRMLR